MKSTCDVHRYPFSFIFGTRMDFSSFFGDYISRCDNLNTMQPFTIIGSMEYPSAEWADLYNFCTINNNRNTTIMIFVVICNNNLLHVRWTLNSNDRSKTPIHPFPYTTDERVSQNHKSDSYIVLTFIAWAPNVVVKIIWSMCSKRSFHWRHSTIFTFSSAIENEGVPSESWCDYVWDYAMGNELCVFDWFAVKHV